MSKTIEVVHELYTLVVSCLLIINLLGGGGKCLAVIVLNVFRLVITFTFKHLHSKLMLSKFG
jgi:hypothetical protein